MGSLSCDSFVPLFGELGWKRYKGVGVMPYHDPGVRFQGAGEEN